MKHYETKTVPAREEQELACITCDLCGRETRDDWEDYRDGTTEVEVRLNQHKMESGYGAFGTDLSFDLCPDCFRNRLIPWLKDQGAEVQEKKWGYW